MARPITDRNQSVGVCVPDPFAGDMAAVVGGGES